MPRLPAPAVRALLEHAEQLAAVAGVLQCLEGLRDAEPAEGSTPGDAVMAIVSAAGAAAGASETAAGVPAAELFFGRPSAAALQLFCAAGDAAARLRDELAGGERAGGSADVALRRLRGMAAALVAAVGSADARRLRLQAAPGMQGQLVRAQASLPTPGWLFEQQATAAWHLMCEVSGAAGSAAGSAAGAQGRPGLGHPLWVPSIPTLPTLGDPGHAGRFCGGPALTLAGGRHECLARQPALAGESHAWYN
jgi:hypothetical protein